MKNILLLFLLFSVHFLHAQLSANAGEDTTICVTWNGFTPLILGGNPTANGGVAPYTFTWECNYVYTVGSYSTIVTASIILSDTTSANPEFIHTIGGSESPIAFWLTVTDSTGQTTTDTIVVSFSVFTTHLIEYSHSMYVGDSVKFVSIPNLGGGIPPVTYVWRPNEGLVDSTSYTDFWVKPVVSTNYYITATDSVGCVVSSTPVFHVYVGYASIENLMLAEQTEIVLYPNPTTGSLYLKSEETNIDVLKIFDQQGALLKVFEKPINQKIDLSDLAANKYLIEVHNGQNVSTQTIIKSE